MKKLFTKSLAVFLAMLMCLTFAPFAFAEGESVEEPLAPVFEVELTSETDTEAIVTLKLVENEFSCLDFALTGNENLQLTKIEMNVEIFIYEDVTGSGSSNIANGMISIARPLPFTAEFWVAKYTFEKLTAEGVTADDFTAELVSCGLENKVDVTDITVIDVAISEEHTHVADGEWTETDAASCDKTGTEVRYCGICGEVAETRETAVKHGETTTDHKDPTCTEPGYDKVICSECNEVISDTPIDATGHSDVTTTDHKDPTCTEPGYDKVICSECNEVISDTPIDATGHSDETTIDRKLATCTEDGYIRNICTVCNGIVAETILPASGHGYIQDVQLPTCTQDGHSREYCPSCGDSKNEVALSQTGHTWLGWKVVTAPTYAKDGVERRICDNCGADEERAIPKLVAKPTEIILNPTETGMSFRQTMRLFANVYPDEAAYSAEIIWESSDENVVTVNEYGEVYAANLGTATVTAKTADGTVTATCEITVTYSTLQWIIIYILFGWIWYL